MAANCTHRSHNDCRTRTQPQKNAYLLLYERANFGEGGLGVEEDLTAV
jgi:hypothetical protein